MLAPLYPSGRPFALDVLMPLRSTAGGCVVVRPFDHYANLCDFHRQYLSCNINSAANDLIYLHGPLPRRLRGRSG